MRVGVPAEIKPDEHRVGLVPASVREYVARGHEVVVQAGAGAGMGVSDEAYRAVGATVVDTAGEVWHRATLVVKVKEPQAAEWPLLRDDHILFTYLHLAADPDQAQALMASGAAAIGYETVTDAQGRLPLLAPMSEVAGRLAIQAAARTLEVHQGGAGILLGGVPGVAPASVTILGAGVVGTNAARMAIGLGAQVTIVDRDLGRLREIDELFRGRAITRYATRDAIESAVAGSDVVVGAVLVPGATAPRLVDAAGLRRMRPRSVVIDVAIDQGGCFETSRPTSHRDPTYVVDGIVHYCVTNMPGAVPRTSSHALNHATLPYGLALADDGLEALARDPGFRAGLQVDKGRITHAVVAESLAGLA